MPMHTNPHHAVGALHRLQAMKFDYHVQTVHVAADLILSFRQ